MPEEQLNKQLTEQLTALKSLAQILDAESVCLKEKTFSSLNEILFNKQKTLQAIKATDQQISTAKNLDAITQSESLSLLKKQIDNNLQDCHKHNQINGRLIELSMKSNKHLMQLLTIATGKNSVTYDKKGTLNSGSLLGKGIKA
jgi:flagella synthesis protein FlgN